MRKIILIIFCLPFLLFTGCNKVDFGAFLTFVVYEIDYETTALEGAAIFTFTNPKLPFNQDIPITSDYLVPTSQKDGFARITYPIENTILFQASLSINQQAEISTPQFQAPDDLTVSNKQANFVTGFTLKPIIKAPPVEYRRFWNIIKDFKITSTVTNDDMEGYIYLYEKVRTDPSTWKWISVLAH